VVGCWPSCALPRQWPACACLWIFGFLGSAQHQPSQLRQPSDRVPAYLTETGALARFKATTRLTWLSKSRAWASLFLGHLQGLWALFTGLLRNIKAVQPSLRLPQLVPLHRLGSLIQLIVLLSILLSPRSFQLPVSKHLRRGSSVSGLQGNTPGPSCQEQSLRSQSLPSIC
jgi:hypothetical protein